MVRVICLSEQQDLPAVDVLKNAADVQFCPLADIAHSGWKVPLILLGVALEEPGVQALFRQVARNPAPLLVLPPLPRGDVAPLLEAPAPVVVVRQRAEEVQVVDEGLKQAVGRDSLRIYCTEGIETALQSGTLATAQGVPAIWSYRRTRTATPVVLVAVQLLLISARSDPLDQEALRAALLAWAEAQIQANAKETGAGAETQGAIADPGVLRALAVAWAVRPDLSRDALLGWMRDRLYVQIDDATLDVALDALRAEGMLDGHDRPQMERLSGLVEAWGLRAWVREARQRGQG